MEEYKHLLPTNCPPPHIVRIILDFILKHSTFKCMDTHIHQILGTSMGTRMAPPYANLFMGKEERTIILTFLHLIYFWKCFIDDIFFIFLCSNSQLKSLMTFMNTISPTIKYTVTYSKQTVTFLDVKIYLSKNRKLKTKLYRKPTDCMTLLHFHSHHPLSCKESIIYSQALRYNMIISEDHILQAELNNLTRILLARSYPLHLIIKNIKKNLDPHPQLPVIPTNTTYRDQHSSHYNPFLRQTTQSHHTQKLTHCCQRHHTLHHMAIQSFIRLHQIQQYS